MGGEGDAGGLRAGNKRVGDAAEAALVAGSIHPRQVAELGIHRDAEHLRGRKEKILVFFFATFLVTGFLRDGPFWNPRVISSGC